jgi:uncharacterized membrane protein
MKKTILRSLILLLFAVWGCNNSGNTPHVSEADSTKTAQNSAKSADFDLKKLSFSGVEPFWGLRFENDFAVYTSPEQLDGVKIFYKKKIGDKNNLTLNEALIKVSDKEFKLFGLMGNSNIEISIKNEKCSNGMSDEDFSYSIVLLKDKKEKYEGCGSNIQ